MTKLETPDTQDLRNAEFVARENCQIKLNPFSETICIFYNEVDKQKPVTRKRGLSTAELENGIPCTSMYQAKETWKWMVIQHAIFNFCGARIELQPLRLLVADTPQQLGRDELWWEIFRRAAPLAQWHWNHDPFVIEHKLIQRRMDASKIIQPQGYNRANA